MENASDQEQLEAIRKWWNENGKAVVGGLLLGLGGVLGWQYWQDRERGLAEEASVLYFQTSESLAADNVAQGQSRGQALKQDYPGSPYAALAALALAARDVEAEQYDAAAVQLRWVVDNATQPELVDVARLRLARVMMAKGEGDQGQRRHQTGSHQKRVGRPGGNLQDLPRSRTDDGEVEQRRDPCQQ